VRTLLSAQSMHDPTTNRTALTIRPEAVTFNTSWRPGNTEPECFEE